jgi:hypothetical protein
LQLFLALTFRPEEIFINEKGKVVAELYQPSTKILNTKLLGQQI